MSLIACKFGGSSLADAQGFRRVRGILDADLNRRVVVVSAPGKRHQKEAKLTDLLYACHDLASRGVDISQPFLTIRERFLQIEEDLGLHCGLSSRLDEIRGKLNEGASKEFLASRGEYLNGLLMANYLGAEFVDPADRIVFLDSGGIAPQTYQKLGLRLRDRRGRFVIPGFYGSDSRGTIRTFSRGGSDITGAIAARAAGAGTYENWTDVSGFLMADPAIVPEARRIDQITYRELRELAYMGAKVFHNEAIIPVREVGIPIHIRNTHRPDDPGTRIVPELTPANRWIAGVAGIRQATLINIEKSMMNKEIGFGRQVLGIFENHGVNYEHSPSGIDSMSVVVQNEELGDRAPVILEDIRRLLEPDEVTIHPDLSLIATVGEGMLQHVGTAAHLFSALRDARVNVRIIDQGSSEINITVGVFQKDYEKAIRALYNAFCSPSR